MLGLLSKVKSGGNGFILFDVGQFERATAREVMALLWLIAAISSPERARLLRETALLSLSDVVSLRPDRPSVLTGSAEGVVPREATSLERLAMSLDEAMQPFDDGAFIPSS